MPAGIKVTVTLTEAVLKRLEEMAKQRGLSKSAIVTIAITKMDEEEQLGFEK